MTTIIKNAIDLRFRMIKESEKNDFDFKNKDSFFNMIDSIEKFLISEKAMVVDADCDGLVETFFDV